jgi:hypothetical protein
MHAPNLPDLRRSSRLPLALPILVTSLEPNSDFSEVCETLVVNAHGCAIRSSTKLEAGVPVQFQNKDGRWTMAHIVDCQPMDSGQRGWKLGAMLDEPENFWGVETCPEDWGPRPAKSSQTQRPRKSPPANGELKSAVSELVMPLQAEVARLSQQLAQAQSRRSQFDISLSHIPPEVEEKIWIRLRDDLGAQVLEQTRQQSQEVFAAAKEEIQKKTREAQREFREHLAQQLQTVEQRAQSISEEISDSVKQHVHSAAERLQQQALETGIRLERRSEEFFRTLQQRLGGEYDAHRREMQKAHAEVASEAQSLRAQTADLGSRITKLDDSVRRLESDLDARLVQMSRDIISGARTQLESALNVVLKELGTRNAKELEKQLSDACAKLQGTQKKIEASVSELLKTEVAGTLLSFGQTMEDLAQDSVGRWRQGLAKDLDSLAKMLGGNFRLESASGRNQAHKTSDE